MRIDIMKKLGGRNRESHPPNNSKRSEKENSNNNDNYNDNNKICKKKIM